MACWILYCFFSGKSGEGYDVRVDRVSQLQVLDALEFTWKEHSENTLYSLKEVTGMQVHQKVGILFDKC